MPYPPAFSGYLLPDGSLFYDCKVALSSNFEPFSLWRTINGGAMLRAD